MDQDSDAEITPDAVVLVVEDNTQLRELYAEWLAPLYDVRTAATGDGALDRATAEVDVILLDRNLPELSGDEVLDIVRSRGLDCKVAMVTAVDPTTDIVGMPFDDYLVKPVTRNDLLHAVESLLGRTAYADLVDRYFELTAKLGVLEATHDEAELADDEAYQRLSEAHRVVADTLAEERASLREAGALEDLDLDLDPE